MSQKFVQIIDFESQRIDEMQQLLDRFGEQMQGTSGGPTHRILLADREQPGRHLAIIEFESYEEAMRNNERPEVAKLNEQLTALCTRQPSFTNCDQLDSRELK
ncbi:hypothetical protein H9Y04_25155 [Streptomyces sp. TRM66268-LWL]|uniref:ABM domain-containing protein n=1 Tax=Streptomyces polyasparticus TaxID=2767826 RepID=A0ABR7SKL6_9ACTN|nr:hypothetical protein [Streptomyces polyasparticus]MBC9715834.1 hypothetical protein [Streptomyces polyasparticus]